MVGFVCPEADYWRRLLKGEMPLGEIDRLAKHLEQCPHCQEQVERLQASDILIETLRAEASTARSEDSFVETLIVRLRKQQPFPPSVDTPAEQGENEQTAPLPAPAFLGDFRIVREVGRGGMGIVYEAEQTTLGRRVALKVLPFAATLDSKQLQRFKNEAQAAAHLHHPNIVGVYAVGCERGVHYYAMQFIDGESLATVIQGLRSRQEGRTTNDERMTKTEARTVQQAASARPCLAGTSQTAAALGQSASDIRSAFDIRHSTFFHAAARLVRQAAEALEHAHQVGVIHRDIKPANLLVDLRGHLWVTDFGLARWPDQAPLTLTGDLLGTLRYMSPEQALAEHGLVDHRSDVYSLGVTLYELLTLEPALSGQDRQELLMQNAYEEARPPRRLNKAIPRELETVVLKAIAKRAEERYATAQELADDLERFLEDKPIQAKRPTLLQRTRKWARRHRAVVWCAGLSSLLVLILAMTGLAVNNLRIAAEQRRTDNALRDEKEALHKLSKAVDRERQALYHYRVQLAHREWTANNVGRAKQHLDDCPVSQRHWEWHYLKRLCHADTLTCRGHKGGIYCVAFSPDGKQLASASLDRTVKLWDSTTGQEVRTLRGLAYWPRSVAFSPDGRRLASATSGLTETLREPVGEVKVWDAATGHGLLSFRGKAGINCVTFSPDGQRLALATGDGAVKLCEAATGREVLTLQGHRGRAERVTFSPDGKHLASGGSDGSVRLWETASGKPLHILEAHPGGINSVGFSPDGRLIASAGTVEEGTIKLWDAGTGKRILTLGGNPNPLNCAAFSPDGRHLISGNPEGLLQLWDIMTGAEVQRFVGNAGLVMTLVFNRAGDRFASAGGERIFKVWTTTAAQQARTFRGHQSGVTSVAFSANRRLASASFDTTAKIWNCDTGQEALTFCGHALRVPSMAFSPDGRRVASATVLDYSQWRSAPSPKRTPNEIKVWDAATGREFFTIPHAGDRVAFSPDGQRLASLAGPWVIIWDASNGQEITRIRESAYGDGALVGSVGLAFSPDGAQLAYIQSLKNSGEKTSHLEVKVRDASTGAEVRSLHGHRSPLMGGGLRAIAFSPDGRFLVTASLDETIKLWDAATGQELRTLLGHTDGVHTVAFTADSRRLASAGRDRTIKIWDPATGQELLTLREHTDSVLSVAFSPDGRYLASGSVDRSVKLWDATPLDEKPRRMEPEPATREENETMTEKK